MSDTEPYESCLPGFQYEQHPEAAAVEDFRPGARMILKDIILTHPELSNERTAKIASYPHEVGYEVDLGVSKTKFVDCKIDHPGSQHDSCLSLARYGVVAENIGRYNRNHVAVLDEPAAGKGELYSDRLEDALQKPFKELDGLEKILVRAYIARQSGKFPEDA